MEFRHKNIRLDAAQYIGQRWCFITMCCAARRRVFAIPKNAQSIVGELRREAVQHLVAVFAYCVMPDHLHILIQGSGAASDLLSFMKGFKQKTAFEYEKKFRTLLWQKKFYDRLLRPKDSPEAVAEYIWMNPVRKGICKNPQDYPFSGSLVENVKVTAHTVEAWMPEWKANSDGMLGVWNRRSR